MFALGVPPGSHGDRALLLATLGEPGPSVQRPAWRTELHGRDPGGSPAGPSHSAIPATGCRWWLRPGDRPGGLQRRVAGSGRCLRWELGPGGEVAGKMPALGLGTPSRSPHYFVVIPRCPRSLSSPCPLHCPGHPEAGRSPPESLTWRPLIPGRGHWFESRVGPWAAFCNLAGKVMEAVCFLPVLAPTCPTGTRGSGHGRVGHPSVCHGDHSRLTCPTPTSTPSLYPHWP